MASEWRTATLGSLLKGGIRHGIYKPLNAFGTGTRVLKMGVQYSQDRIGPQEMPRVPVSDKELVRFGVHEGDLLFSRTSMMSDGAGKCSLVVTHEEPFVFDGNILCGTPDIGVVDPAYIFYFFKSPVGKQAVSEIIAGTQSRSLSGTNLSAVEIIFPKLNEQKAIAHVLGALDDRIELNRRMNETLEGMAQALFKSWFVDFDPVIDNASGKEVPEELGERAAARTALGDRRKPLPADIRALFPDEFTLTDELGWIPKGWEVTTLDNLIELIGGGTPKTSVEEYWGGDIPWFSVVDAPASANVFVIDTEKHVTQLGVDNSSTKILPVGTTIISARGTVGKCALVGRPMAMNQSCYGIRGNKGISDYFVYYAVRNQVEHLQRGGHGSVFNTITRDTFKIIKMPMGKAQHTQKFGDCIKPFLDKILANSIQNTVLSKLRDTLLPKLLSGEVRIPDAEKMAAEAGL
jgi:type I restriction enzyme S subunit